MQLAEDHKTALDVQRALDADPLLPKGRIRAFVRCGWVMLAGEVDRSLHRWSAEADVRQLPRVAGVDNRIVVRG